MRAAFERALIAPIRDRIAPTVFPDWQGVDYPAPAAALFGFAVLTERSERFSLCGNDTARRCYPCDYHYRIGWPGRGHAEKSPR
jgi:hypothetical protein